MRVMFVLAGSVVALLNMALVFVSWAYHPGAVANPDAAVPGAQYIFPVVSFPAAYLPVISQFFWAVMIGNALFWGVTTMLLCVFWVRVKRQTSA
jgi:hypothetical protein